MPDTILKHVWASGLELSESVCELHGWKLREARPQVFDAVLFSTELDLLELRWNEVRALILLLVPS
jgi:beta-1,4-mannosyl-glycoprotein beta-1,4-N-acetylglucosaminyltransferase